MTDTDTLLPAPPEPAPDTLADLDAERERFKAQPESAEDEPESGGVPDFTLEDLGWFCYERQAIWHRRFVEERPAPWTDDETLREWRICNIYRELDKGTQYCRQNVAERRKTIDGVQTSLIERTDLLPLEDQRARMINTVVYRLLNRSDSWEKYVGWLEPPYDDALKAAVERLEEASSAGESVSTNTWRASTLTEFLRSGLLVIAQADELHELCSAANSLKMIHAILSRGYEIGDFTAYQVARDLQFVYPNLDSTDWVFVYGRGTRRKDGHGGSMWALKKVDPLGEPIETARHLRDTQDEWLPAEWSEVAWQERPHLSLADVDDLCCEFRKYWLKRHGQGSLRRYGDEPVKVRRARGEGQRRNRSASNNWETPPALFTQLSHERGPFTVDAAATSSNALLERYWSIADDGLRQSWASERVFCHPPFGEIRDWTAKAISERERADCIVMLVPAYLDTKWWHENVVGTASEIRFVKGQAQFYENGEPRPVTFQGALAIVTWYPTKDSDPEPIVTWGYTWPGRVTVRRAGWTGT